MESTIIIAAVVLWFANGYYINGRLEKVHAKLDRTLEELDGLRRYLYEIDPRFDEERRLEEAFENGDDVFTGYDHMNYVREREREGRRTLNTRFTPE